MVTAGDALALAVMVLVNAGLAAVTTRLLRVRLATDWGAAVYVAVLGPLVLGVTTLLMGAVAGPDLGSQTAVLALLILFPLTLGVALDVLWMPAPEEVELPDTTD